MSEENKNEEFEKNENIPQEEAAEETSPAQAAQEDSQEVVEAAQTEAQAEAQTEQESVEAQDNTSAETVSDENINVENTALDTLIIKEYIDEIDKVLKGNQRDIIFLKIFDDKTDNEIADILNIKVNKVSKTYSEARNKLVRKSNLIRLRFFELERSKVNSWKSTDWDKDIYYENKIESLRRELEKENRKLLENKMSINKMISKKI